MTIFQKISHSVLAAALLSVVSSSAYGSNFRSGFIVGGSVGQSTLRGAESNETLRTVTAIGLTVRTPTVVKRNLSSTGVAGGLFAGYRTMLSSGLIAGFNLGLNMDRASIKKDRALGQFVSYNTKLSRQFQITPSLMIGNALNDRWMVFGELALNISRFNMKSSRVATAALVPSKTATKNDSFFKLGFMPTIGVEYAMNQNLSVLGTVSYEIYKTFKRDVGATDPQTPVGQTATTQNSVKFKPSYFSTKIGLLYKF